MEGLVPPVPASAEAIITLTTDFGVDDAYVAAMKGVILGINPGATIVDISHSIEPQNIRQGAFVFSTAYSCFPQDTIHLVVVDPGVGGQRRAIIVETSNAIFVAPDNGVLSYVVQACSTGKRISRPTMMRLPPELQAFEITNSRYWRQPVSATFHGRDIFAPVAAHISLGTRLNELGQAINSINVFPLSRPRPTRDGIIVAHILHIDHFGNLVTDVTSQDLPSGQCRIEVAGHQIDSLSQSYDQGQGLLGLIGSSGRLEIALKGGSAARLLASKVGDELRLISETACHDRG